jgi:hypothetical protein
MNSEQMFLNAKGVLQMRIVRIKNTKAGKIHLKNRTRFVTVLVVMSLLTYLFFIPTITSGTQEQQFVQVYVEKGDTLWDIASRYDPQGDIRKLIFEIRKFNNMESYNIMAGSYIKVPI